MPYKNKEDQREWRKKNAHRYKGKYKEARKRADKRHREANPEKRAALQRAWRKTPQGKETENARRRKRYAAAKESRQPLIDRGFKRKDIIDFFGLSERQYYLTVFTEEQIKKML